MFYLCLQVNKQLAFAFLYQLFFNLKVLYGNVSALLLFETDV